MGQEAEQQHQDKDTHQTDLVKLSNRVSNRDLVKSTIRLNSYFCCRLSCGTVLTGTDQEQSAVTTSWCVEKKSTTQQLRRDDQQALFGANGGRSLHSDVLKPPVPSECKILYI